MGQSSTVQFNGADAVLTAYDNRKIAAWSIWSGSQFMFSSNAVELNEGRDELQNILEAISEHGSAARYTLKVHKIKKGEDITDKTPNLGSFNFLLNDAYRSGMPVLHGVQPGNAKLLLDKIAALELENKQLQEQIEPEEDETDALIGKAERIMQLPIVQNIIGMIMGKTFNNVAGAVGNTGDNTGTVTEFGEALEILLHAVPDFEAMIIKLASQAKKEPEKTAGKLKMAMTFL